MKILKICKAQAFRDQEMLCEHGSKSTEMFILLSGSLSVHTKDGIQITSPSPIKTVGEMGVITGQPRSATVVADRKASVLEISKIKLEVLLKKYPDIGFLIYRNIIDILSHRLDETNHKLSGTQQELSELKQTGILSS